MIDERGNLNREGNDEMTSLPRVGLYTCPMCQGRGVCSKSVSDFEKKSRLSHSFKRQVTMGTQKLEDTTGSSSWLPELPDFSSYDTLQELHPARLPSSKNSFISGTSDSVQNHPFAGLTSVSRSYPSPGNRTVLSQNSSRRLTFNKNIDERIGAIWPNAIRESPSARSKQIPSIGINLKDMPKELPKVIYKRSTTTGRLGHNASKNESTVSTPEKTGSKTGDLNLLLADSKRPSQPEELLRVAILGLQSNEWEHVVHGLQGVVQVSRWQPSLIEPYMAIVNRCLLSLLRGLRSHVTRLACQAAGELFRTMQCTNRPEFDELVGALLLRTADLNRFIRQDANEALDAMVTYLPPQPCVRALVFKGCSHKHPQVRTAAARLLTCCSVEAGPGGLIGHCHRKDIRTALLSHSAMLLNDPNQETRLFARKLFESLVQHEDFDSIFQMSVDEKLLAQVDKTVTLIKYHKNKPPSS